MICILDLRGFTLAYNMLFGFYWIFISDYSLGKESLLFSMIYETINKLGRMKKVLFKLLYDSLESRFHTINRPHRQHIICKCRK